MERWVGLLIIAAAVVALMVPFWVYVALVRSAHRKFALAQPASTLTVVGVRDKDLAATVSRAQHGDPNLARVPFTFVVTISPEGVMVWSGGLSPRLLETISADRVLSIDLGSYTERPEYRQPSLPRFKVTVSQLQESAAMPVDLQFGITKMTTGPFIARYLDEPGLQELVVQAREALRGGDPSAVVAPSAQSFTPRPGQLEPGTTAFRASHLGPVPVSRVITGIWIVAAAVFLFAVYRENLELVVVVIGVQVVAIGALLWRQSRAEAREVAAGYTTLNGRNLQREQRHPVTGMVIRDAGGTAIPPERFRELLGR